MRTREFASSEELLDAIRADATEATRFPARFLLLSGLEAWRETVDALKAEVDQVVSLSGLGGQDALPTASDVIQQIEQHKAERILVLPLGEILRFVPDSASLYIGRLASLSRPGRSRIYVPILDVPGLVEHHLSLNPHFLALSPEPWGLRGEGDIEIEVAPFQFACSRGAIIQGFRAYLRKWEQGGVERGVLISQLAPYLTESQGRFTARVCANAYDIVRKCISGAQDVQPEWGTEEQWNWLAQQVHSDESLRMATARLLNVQGYNARQLFELWSKRDANLRWLTWLWSKLEKPVTSFIGQVAAETRSADEIAERAANAVFAHPDMSMEYLAERRGLLMALDCRDLSPSFWSEFARQSDPLKRLKALPCLSQRDQEQIIRQVGSLLQDGRPPNQWMPILQLTYPQLAAYLTSLPYADGFLTNYMALYNQSRIADEAMEQLEAEVNNWAANGLIWKYRTRAALLQQLQADKRSTLWADAMGLEWAGLLSQLLIDKGLEVECLVARANLPSITSMNKDWDEDAEPWRELDNIAHHYDYSYPASLVQQLARVTELADKISAMTRDRPEVVVTSDHGLTRFAAQGAKVAPPANYRVHKWGRYAFPEADNSSSGLPSDEWLVNEANLVLAKHSLFQGGSRAVGEVHGGATPEESIVPILRVSQRITLPPQVITAERQVRLDVHGQGQLHVELDKPAKRLRLVVDNNTFWGEELAPRSWGLKVIALRTGHHTGQLYSEQGVVGQIEFEVIRGIQESDMGL